MVRCKICNKTVKSTGCTGKHCWESSQQCFDCHYIGINTNMSRTIKYNKLNIY
jgi:hypothetical protein